MDIDYRHFHSNKTYKEISASLALFHKLNSSLKEIVFEELKLGNVILDISEGYPKPGSIFVSLSNGFMKKHSVEGVDYKELTDPHYWKEEYSCGEPLHLISCPF